jgi:hypothetical protein
MQGSLQSIGAPLNLSVARKPEIQFLHMQTEFIHIGFDGKRTGVNLFSVITFSIVSNRLRRGPVFNSRSVKNKNRWLEINTQK